ncbi:cysteine--tRNA ligase [Candidatus Venteria ishoeyi]|uniref:Cysteinyl-tRNA synthetase n=1 Tax=Candidatus Venteria ishoeyi TaxID=1899563 RepID=A0A1H6FF85_9GAMM|nr:hypothetical protein [Candidatus Venteria ishoeyi]SEH08687.1 Uncharacterised protein [Candidatus Venteria ishoeyi]
MPNIIEDELCFTFDENWQVTQYDQWAFYRDKKGFNGIIDGVTGLDIIAINQENTVWLIEIKDFRKRKGYLTPEVPSDLPNKLAKKVICTLAALLPAKLNAEKDIEKTFSLTALNAASLRIALHLELPDETEQEKRQFAGRHSQILQVLRNKLRSIDINPSVFNMESKGMPWSVTLTRNS